MAILISTITPCFRMKKYLKKFLDELPQQTIFNELEIVLDHNEPDEEEISWVKDFQAKYPGRLKHIIVPKVDPIGTSMNRCIKEASGDLVCIWNVDDLRTPNSIELQCEAFKGGPEVGIAYGNYKSVTSFGSTDGITIDFENTKEDPTRSFIFGPFVMFRKKLLERSGYFDEQLKSGADFDLLIRLALISKSRWVTGNLGYYLNEGLGASTRPNSKQPLERTIIELRYGIYDKIDYDYLPATTRYDVRIPSISQFGEYRPVSAFVPDYENFMQKREKEWFKAGLRRFVRSRSLPAKIIRRIKKIKKHVLHPCHS
jgi:glycosyltransferase involved in cell wall biosynthesis